MSTTTTPPTTHREQLLARYPAGGATYSLGRRLNDLAALLTDDGWLPRIRDFAARYGDSLDPQLAAAAADSAAANAAWLRDSAPAVCAWLDRAVRATPP